MTGAGPHGLAMTVLEMGEELALTASRLHTDACVQPPAAQPI